MHGNTKFSWNSKLIELSRGFLLADEQMKKRKHIPPTYEEDKLKVAVHQRGIPTLRPHVTTFESNMYLYFYIDSLKLATLFFLIQLMREKHYMT